MPTIANANAATHAEIVAVVEAGQLNQTAHVTITSEADNAVALTATGHSPTLTADILRLYDDPTDLDLILAVNDLGTITSFTTGSAPNLLFSANQASRAAPANANFQIGMQYGGAHLFVLQAVSSSTALFSKDAYQLVNATWFTTGFPHATWFGAVQAGFVVYQNDWLSSTPGAVTPNPIFQADTLGIRTQVAGIGWCTKEGSNAKQGVVTLSGATTTVANKSITANSRIFLTSQNDNGGTPGFLRVTARVSPTTTNATAIVLGNVYTILTLGTTDFVATFGAPTNIVGTVFTSTANGTGASGTGTVTDPNACSFTITSSTGASDTSIVAYEIFEPG